MRRKQKADADANEHRDDDPLGQADATDEAPHGRGNGSRFEAVDELKVEMKVVERINRDVGAGISIEQKEIRHPLTRAPLWKVRER